MPKNGKVGESFHQILNRQFKLKKNCYKAFRKENIFAQLRQWLVYIFLGFLLHSTKISFKKWKLFESFRSIYISHYSTTKQFSLRKSSLKGSRALSFFVIFIKRYQWILNFTIKLLCQFVTSKCIPSFCASFCKSFKPLSSKKSVPSYYDGLYATELSFHC